MPRVLDSLPELYGRLLPAVFQQDVPTEAKATCSSCAMCADSCANPVAPVDGVSRLFRPDTKCCTYHPRLPNYLVGAVLADTTEGMRLGRERVLAKLAHRSGVTPQWLKAPPLYDLLYAHAKGAFGRSHALICPYFESIGGGCTIWPYREAVCSTFFCKYVAGADGRTFWMSLKRYLSLIEAQLSRYALLHLYPEYIWRYGDDLGTVAGVLTAAETDGEPASVADHAILWGAWVGKEAEFYRRCYELVRDLNAADVERMLGLDGDVYNAIVAQRYAAAVDPQFPDAPRLNPNLTVRHLDDGSVALGFHSEFDAVALPRAGYDLLAEFKGTESMGAVRQRLRDERGTDFSEELLVELHHHRVLI